MKSFLIHTYSFLIHTNFLTMTIICLLRKVVYPYEYMPNWEKFPVTSLPENEDS